MDIDNCLYLHLASLGDVVPLDFTIDIKKLNTELEQYKDDWKKYHPRKVVDFGRQALPLTSLDGELAGINLDSLREHNACLLYTSPSPRDMRRSRMPSSA